MASVPSGPPSPPCESFVVPPPPPFYGGGAGVVTPPTCESPGVSLPPAAVHRHRHRSPPPFRCSVVIIPHTTTRTAKLRRKMLWIGPSRGLRGRETKKIHYRLRPDSPSIYMETPKQVTMQSMRFSGCDDPLASGKQTRATWSLLSHTSKERSVKQCFHDGHAT